MRRIIKPFAIETRRQGRKPAAAPRPLFEEDDTYREALRAADAFFGKTEDEAPIEAAPEAAPATPAQAPRRILQSLTEEDPLARLLAEEVIRPRRGRKPRAADDLPTLPRAARPLKPTPAPPVQAPAARAMPALPSRITGYVRGLIYARYARHDAARPGEQWRKRSIKPLW